MDEQKTYARWLAFGAGLGFAALVASFAIYLAGLLPPTVPPALLPRYWGMPVAQYVAATGAPTGWGWLRRLGEGDLLNLLGVALLASATVLCYLRMLPLFLARRERLLAAICAAEIVVVAVAASGLITTH